MENIVQAKKGIETDIIMSMLMNDAGKGHHRQKTSKDKISVSFGMFLEKKPVFPKSFYAFDKASGGDRLFSAHLDGTVVCPHKAIGARLETAVLKEDGSLAWNCILPMKRPRGLAAIAPTGWVKWYACHFRKYHPDGSEEYIKEPMAVTMKGKVARLKPLGWKGFDADLCRKEQSEQLALSLSLFEDAHRAGSYLATVNEHVEVMFPVGAEACKDFFAMRDGYKNTPTGRKNPIRHFCRKHLRARSSGTLSDVSSHFRGAREVQVGHMKLSIIENMGYRNYLPS